ncbi:fimbria/pilus outer membrane usher protein [Morganella morganii]|uniref:fimbria/pilus outer membrane usher protein n=1 Tax=Morganella morganii TaxID=582 RepID=UPI0021A91F51|nr:fimbria/pilus outer membrane usher protein [Morganella morganii]
MKLRTTIKIMTASVVAAIQINTAFAEEAVNFNTSFLDSDSQEIDFSKFSRANYVMPGTYLLATKLNNNVITSDENILFYSPEYDPEITVPCITPELFAQLAMKEEWQNKVSWTAQDKLQCLDIRTIPDMQATGDIAGNTLSIRIPQAYMAYSDPSWDPPERWDDGIAGFLFDYNATATHSKYQPDSDNDKSSKTDIVSYGDTGVNLGAWRVRAEWQATGGDSAEHSKRWRWNQIYAYRALRDLSARLMFGEQYLTSELFESFRYIGMSMETDENMFPPLLRGYAPEVAGVARTNATVIIRQGERIIYQEQVSKGPFRIRDMNYIGDGTLNVTIKEQDGSEQHFTIETSRLSMLTRPGQFLFKLAAGKPLSDDHKTEGPEFGTGSFSWGMSNNTTLFGGVLAATDYQNVSVGIGRDIAPFGVFSAKVSYSWANMGDFADKQNKTGGSYSITYSKEFDSINSQLTFAGYRFSERDYMTMNQFVDLRYRGGNTDNSKEMYNIIFNKVFPSLRMNVYLNYSHQTFWNKASINNYSMTLSRNFDWGEKKNLSMSMSAYRTESDSTKDNGIYASLSVPLDDNKGMFSYSGSYNKNSHSNNVNYYTDIDNSSNYSLSAGEGDGKVNLAGFYTNEGGNNYLSLSGTYIQDNVLTVSGQSRGGFTLTREGAAFHRSGNSMAPRILVDTSGTSDIDVRGTGKAVRTNAFGKAIIPTATAYSRGQLSLDLDAMPDNAEALTSVQQATLTSGAIGYRKFNVVEGYKIMGIIAMNDNTHPPFGASVMNDKNAEIGIVADNGSAYLTGIQSGQKLTVAWNGQTQCTVRIPEIKDDNVQFNMLLPCQ